MTEWIAISISGVALIMSVATVSGDSLAYAVEDRKTQNDPTHDYLLRL